MKKFLSVLGVLFIASLAALPAPAQAAMWVGVELGPNFMANNDVKVDISGPSNNSLTSGYRWNTKVLGGVTFGYHFINQGFLAYNWPDWMKNFQFAVHFSFHTIEAGPKSVSPGPVEFSRLKGDVFTVAFLFIGCYGFYPGHG